MNEAFSKASLGEDLSFHNYISPTSSDYLQEDKHYDLLVEKPSEENIGHYPVPNPFGS